MTVLLGRLERLLNAVVVNMAVIAGALISIVTILVCIDVLLRYVFAAPLTGLIEIVELSLVFFTFLAAPWLLKHDKHVRMDLVVNLLSKKTQTKVAIVTSTICSAVCCVIIWYAIGVISDQYQTGQTLPTSLEPLAWPLYTIIPISFFVLLLVFLALIRGYFQKLQASGTIGTGTGDTELVVDKAF